MIAVSWHQAVIEHMSQTRSTQHFKPFSPNEASSNRKSQAAAKRFGCQPWIALRGMLEVGFQGDGKERRKDI